MSVQCLVAVLLQREIEKKNTNMAADPIILGKIEQNCFVLGMTAFSIIIIFNIATYFTLITTGLVKRRTGFCLLFMVVIDTISLTCGVLMDEFYDPLIDIDVFAKCGEPVILCQTVCFFKELCYYWRWLLFAMMVLDRRLLMSSKTSTPQLRISTTIFTLAGFGVSAALAGYWVY